MFPHGYKIIINATFASLPELEDIARTFKDDVIASDPAGAARTWKAIADARLADGKPLPIVTVNQPDGHYSGWVVTPTGDIEKRQNGAVVKILHSNEQYEDTHAYGLDGDVLEERRN
jgi:hypothetical protein